MNGNTKQLKRERRHRRIRAKVNGTAERPRLSVFRSNRGIYAQLIDDEKSTTLVAASTTSVKDARMPKRASELAKAVGKALAERAKQKHITRVVFDRGGYLYAGAIRALAEGAREGGLSF
ncbi:MAG: 50S ribosomal protein L18 [Candidatus Taylorbacteria bacterium RIFCSPHIGHO2_02_49_25]|uniref:Large ribosomal subunit protein uL18 n=1 Tax=Candidatus Taylorbacteria bacterium RIFCSPHIGHO2_02_49_25 TaxID=1802305 RepID=A0A1G2MC80_9BACT|nr:MAG: 50S ribosomal protein L18 [Parcubacteria group bacterium GW2011_GWF2_50_9]OHA21423.1 MAG: 50S ribosomal protein L18 [Candidatus Taylorbacteria bacterium RIFCSPHIGHO2_02_49_25]OHA21601.1 MAG: 50S ribosomal protein L18 [Candidatus Taylorbacteria bacterium RIFCSPHIGHO2_01_FULL_49_60]OHA36796.1 MAG: 50S ribosomal protein L18 [Candidatus Taylorbacteria bacterium RIFCSPLOWO2_01_FULL_50_130]OHA36906.1 MAG: 50S ribosomal protein L18 [Candidatus Taylorbacteria bacterium RIFCSPLOWO2_02_50_13]OHA